MADLPPSYYEATCNSGLKSEHSSATPSAPRLDAIVPNFDSGNTHLHPTQLGAPYTDAHNEGRFSEWDDGPTELLIANRLAMNERFEKARNQQERDELWDEILNHLLAAGYNFKRIDLIQYWEYEFYIYKSIVNSLSTRNQPDSGWKYFGPIDSVFKYSTEALKSKSTGEGDAAVISSPVNNSFGGLTNLEPIDALPSQPISSVYNGVQNEPVISSQPNSVLKIPADNIDVVTTQPSTLARGYVPVAPSRNRVDDDDCCCCCCIGCCDDDPGGYPRRTGGYSRRTNGNTNYNENYNTFDHTGYGGYTSDFTGGYTDDDNHCHTSSHTNDDNRDDGYCGIGGGDYGGCDTGGGGTDNGCCDSGGGGTDGGCYDSGGGGCDDSGGGGCDDSGGGGCDDSGGGGCDD